MHTLPILVLLALATAAPPAAPLCIGPATPAARAADFPKLSPFQAVRMNGQDYEVLLDAHWYRLLELDGISSATLLAHCNENYSGKAEKRFAEDLVEVLDGLGHDPGQAIDLVLVSLERGERVERAGVPMTEANRRLVWSARNARAAASTPVGRVERTHSPTSAPHFARLAEPLVREGWAGAATLSRRAAERDLDQLEWLIEHTYSYRDLLGVDFRGAFDAVRSSLADENPLGAFATRVAQLLALFGDGHTRVSGLERYRPTGYLPFLVAETEVGVAAFLSDRSAFLDPEHPFLVALDGRALDEWVALSARTAAAGSDSFVRRQGLRGLRLLGALRAEAGLEPAAEVEVVLANAAGDERVARFALAERKPLYGPWPRTDEHALLEGNIGYLRIPSMDDEPEFLRGLTDALAAFRETRGLVIDVRGNGGGTRDALRVLLPWFLAPEDGPRVVNVAAYRLRPDDPRDNTEGYLQNRSMAPASSRHWNDLERRAIEVVAGEFTPDWTLAPGSFSAWHYFVLSPGADHYDQPVVVLLDSGCFSATDIFLGAFAGLPGVTLMGTPSGGGSGRSQRVRLVESGLSLRLSSMASFRADGRRYDGLGVEPDVLVRPAAVDLLAGNRSAAEDTALAAALERLR